MKTAVDRILEVLKSKGISKRAFAAEVGINPDSFYSATRRNSDITSSMLGKIATKYVHLNTRWVLTGEGEMWLNQTKKPKSEGTQALNNDVLKQLKEVKSQNADLKKQAKELRSSYNEVESERKILFQALMGILPSKTVNIESEKMAKVVSILQSELNIVI